jgi:hypothetical protein
MKLTLLVQFLSVQHATESLPVLQAAIEMHWYLYLAARVKEDATNCGLEDLRLLHLIGTEHHFVE